MNNIEKMVVGARSIEQVPIHMNADYFKREKKYIEEQKKRFEFVERHETYDVYKHKTKGFCECFPNYYL